MATRLDTGQGSMPLRDVFESFGSGAFVRPSFQRPFVWHADLIRELIWSILHGYFTGSLLLWDAFHRDGEDPLKTYTNLGAEPLLGWPEEGWPTDPDSRPEWVTKPQAAPKFVVLDGQQRLTAMFCALMPGVEAKIKVDEHDTEKGEYEFFVQLDKFDLKTKSFTSKEAINFSKRLSDADKDAITKDISTHTSTDNPSNPSPDWKNHMKNKNLPLYWWHYIREHKFPLYLLSSDPTVITYFFDAYLEHWVSRENVLEDQEIGQELQDLNGQLNAACGLKRKDTGARAPNAGAAEALMKARDYQVSYVQIPFRTDVDRVRDVFMQLNTYGVQLTPFEFYNAKIAMNGNNPQGLFDDISKMIEARTYTKFDRGNLENCVLEMLLLSCVHDIKTDNPYAVDDDGGQSGAHKRGWSGEVNNLKWNPHLLPKSFQNSKDKKIGMSKTADGQLIDDYDDLKYRLDLIKHKLETGLGSLVRDSMFGTPPQATWQQIVPQEDMLPYFCALVDLIQNKKDQSSRHADLERLQQWWWAWTLSGEYGRLTRREKWEDLDAMERWFKQPADTVDTRVMPQIVKNFVYNFKADDLDGALAAGDGEQATPKFLAALNFIYSAGPVDFWHGIGAKDSANVIFKSKEIISPEQLLSADAGNRKIRSVFNRWFVSIPLESRIDEILSNAPNDWFGRLNASLTSRRRQADGSIGLKGDDGKFDNNINLKIRETWKSHLITMEAVGQLEETPFTTLEMKRFIELRKEEFLRQLTKIFKVDFGQPEEIREIALAAADIEEALRDILSQIYASSENREQINKAFKGVRPHNSSEKKDPPEQKAQRLADTNRDTKIKKELDDLLHWRGLYDIATIIENGAYGLSLKPNWGNRKPMRLYGVKRGASSVATDLRNISKVRNAVFHAGEAGAASTLARADAEKDSAELTAADVVQASIGIGRLRTWIATKSKN